MLMLVAKTHDKFKALEECNQQYFLQEVILLLLFQKTVMLISTLKRHLISLGVSRCVAKLNRYLQRL